MAEKDVSKAAGGKARAESLTPSKRSSIAKAAAAARWGYKVTHKGNFAEAFGLDVDCYVLDDDSKTAVISQIGMAVMLLNEQSGGTALPKFAKGKIVSQALGAELLQRIDNPLIFKGDHVGAKGEFQGQVNGYEVGLLIDICQALIMADSRGELGPRYQRIANQARIILGASAKAGIQGLVYALAGYDRTKEEVIEAYKLYVREEAREYEKEFSPELYEQWYRLYGLTKPERGRPWEFKYLTIDHIYKPLARSHGKVFDLAKASKQVNGEKGDKVHMFLSEIGVKALRTQIGKIIGIATVSDSRAEYEKYIAEKIYGQQSLDLRE
ncbi:P63C domain-containing protein [Pseudomonas moraviensis]|uniref:P63C domain-containing protein n=1 Tax=Pseudomonas moraviensis TaxID=321662 RepID=UPI0038052576